MVEQKRVTYGIITMFTDMGGIIKVGQVVINFLVQPIQHFLYMMVMISHLYIANTKKKDIF